MFQHIEQRNEQAFASHLESKFGITAGSRSAALLKNNATFLVLLAATCSLAQAQQASAQSPHFEVASVKAANPAERSVDFRVYQGPRLKVTNATLRRIILKAYDLRDEQLLGGPDWIQDSRYDIEAKGDPATDPHQVMVMLQTLLAERFGLRAHRSTKEGRVYTLIVAKGGPKARLEPSTKSNSRWRHRRNTPDDQPGRSYTFVAEKTAVGALAEKLSNELGVPVSDRTGLVGDFDFTLDFEADESSDSTASIVQAVQEQLGLKLVPGKGPVEVLIIDGVGKLSAN